MSKVPLNFQPLVPLWIMFIGFVLSVALLYWKERQRQVRFFWWRMLAATFMLASIVGLILQPALEFERSSRGVVLLTPHYKKKVADSLRNVNSDLTFFRLEESEPYHDAKSIFSIRQLQETKIQYVLGDGLPYYLVEDSGEFEYFKSEQPNGIVQLAPPFVSNVDQRNEIHGRINSRGDATLKLLSAMGAEDSLKIIGKGTHTFTLSFFPKQSGLFTYQIELREVGETYVQKLPIEVIPNEKLTILFLQHYPTAESKFLRHHLIEQGHHIVARSQLSKDNYRYEYSNQEKVSLNHLSSDLLNAFDLVIIDNETVAFLNASERNVLETAIKDGLGIMLLFNAFDKKTGNDFFTLPFIDFPKDTVKLKIKSSSYTFPVLPVTIKADEVITQTKERILSGYINKLGGKVGFQLLQETYKLLLQGKRVEYSTVWTPILERVARYRNPAYEIQLKNRFPMYRDEPLNLNVISSGARPELTLNGVAIPLREDLVIDDYFYGTGWAGKPGWHQLRIAKDSTVKNFYVSAPSEWQSLRITQQQSLNELASRKANGAKKEAILQIESKPISKLVFFLIFLLSSGFLWLAPKL